MAVTIKGLSGLQAKLNKLDPKTRAAAFIGVAKAGLLVEWAAKLITPVSTEITRPGGPHGELRDSIESKATKTYTGAKAEIGTNKEYAPYVEFGTSRQRAQPYLHPALQKNRRAVKKIVRDEIRRAI